jgi:hypothetical protein
MVARRKTAREIEMGAAAARPSRSAPRMLTGEAAGMLARRGLRPGTLKPNLPFPPDFGGEAAERLLRLLGHYAFRLFLRGAIQKFEGFAADEATGYVKSATARTFADALVDLGIAGQLADGRYQLSRRATSFGPTLEWYVARELERRFGFDVVTGVKFHARGIGGDLDVVAAAEGKLVYLELKSSPPKHLSDDEVRAFFDRVGLLRPDITLFVMDTALRLSDKVVPMLHAELARRAGRTVVTPRRIKRELWALTPHLYAVNSRPDLVANIGLAIAQGLNALAPSAPWTCAGP